MAATLLSKVSVSPDQVSCDLAGEAVVLSISSGQYFGLSPVGARIWALLQDGRSILEVRDVLMGEYDVDRERCTSDLLALLAELTEAGLVTIES